MTSSGLVRGFGALALAIAAMAAHAAPTVYFGENQSPGFAVSGAPATARSSFLGNLSGVRTESFESFTLASVAPIVLSFTGSNATSLGATLTGTGQISNNTSNGRWNTSPGGSKWWDVNGSFNIAFNTAISAFGFYGTDIGDFNGQVTLSLTDEAGNVTLQTVNNTMSGRDGSLLFWGFTDTSTKYTNISFGNTSTSGVDFFGFDDMVVGDLGQITSPTPGLPEPGTLALVGLSLLGLAAVRRKH